MINTQRFRSILFRLFLIPLLLTWGSQVQAQNPTFTQQYVQHWDDSTSLPANWSQSDGTANTVVGPNQAVSAPNTLGFQGGGGGEIGEDFATIDPQADVAKSSWFSFSTLTSTGDQTGLRLRDTSPTWGSGNSYVAMLVVSSTGIYAHFSYFTGTSESDLGGVGTSGYTPTTSEHYWLQGYALGSTLALRLKRASDGKWLNSGGAWVTDGSNSTWAYTTTDTHLANAGYGGFYCYNAGGGTYTYTDDYESDTVTAAVVRSPATFYVDATAGSDGNSGTDAAHAWQTLGKASTGPSGGYIAGDALLLTSGETFAGTLALTVAGTAALPMTVKTTASGRATINTTTASANGLSLSDCAYTHVSNLTLTGPGVNSDGTHTSTGSGVSVTTTTTVSSPTFLSGDSVDNCSVSGFYNGVAAFTASGTPTTAGTGPGTSMGLKDLRLTNLNITGCCMAGLVTGVTGQSGTAGYGIVGLTIDHCTVSNITGDPAVANQSGQGIQLWYVQNGLISNCVVHDGAAHMQTGAPNGGPVAIWCAFSDNLTFQFDEAYNWQSQNGNDGGGFDLDGGTTGSVVQYCYSHDNYGAGYQAVVSQSAVSNNTFRYCVTQNDGRKNQASLFLYGGPTNTRFQNLTVYADAAHAVSGHQMAGWLSNGDGSGDGVYNCAFYLKSGVHLADSPGGMTFLGNVYYDPGGSPFSWAGTTYSTIAAFRTGTGLETLNGSPVGLAGDPKFRAAGTGAAGLSSLTAYDLLVGSPLIDVGLDMRSVSGYAPAISAPSSDLHGTPLWQGVGYDVGAVEYSAGGSAIAGDVQSAVLAALADVGLAPSRPYTGPAGHVGAVTTGGTAGETDAGILSVLAALAQVGLSPNTPYTGPAGSNK